MAITIDGTNGITSPGGDSVAVDIATPKVKNAGTLALEATGANVITFSNNGAESARINADGNLLVGTTSFAAGQDSKSLNEKALFSSRNLTTAAGHISFQNPNGQVGLISTSGSSTIYATSSDVRLKENLVPITDALTRISTISVYRFNFIADPTKTVDGFVAHELAAHVPEAVTGEKDEVDEDGNPVHQGVDQSKLVPLLTAAVQELLEEVSTLTARIEALEQA